MTTINDSFFLSEFFFLLLRIKGQVNLLRVILNHFQMYDFLRVVAPQMLHVILTEGLQQQQL